MNIILCGMPCCGKTHFGKIAADMLNMNFVDTDELIMTEYFKSHQQKATCREITLKEGEHYFRSLESEIIKRLKNSTNSIIAIGGGALCLRENIPYLKKLGRLIYLKTPPKILLERLMKKKSLPSYLKLEMGVQNNRVIQDLELESPSMGVDHSQKVKATHIERDSDLKVCDNLLSSNTVSKLNKQTIEKSFMALLEQRLPLYEENCDLCIDTTSQNVIAMIKNQIFKESNHGK